MYFFCCHRNKDQQTQTRLSAVAAAVYHELCDTDGYLFIYGVCKCMFECPYYTVALSSQFALFCDCACHQAQ